MKTREHSVFRSTKTIPAVAIVDPDGKLATVYYGEQWEPETVLQDLQKARKG